MKILIVTPNYYPAIRYGGPVRSLHAMNKEFLCKGQDVSVYTTDTGLEGKVVVNKEIRIDNVKVTYFSFKHFFDFLGSTGWQFSPKMSGALKNNIESFDIVYISPIWNYSVASAAHYCRRFKKPYVISPRGALYPYALSKKIWKKKIYYNLVARRDVEGASVVHYTTEDEARKCHVTLHLKNREVVIPNGLELAEFSSLPDRHRLRARYPFLGQKKIIMFSGRIAPIKGLDILINAFRRIVEEREDVHLLIMGMDETGYSQELKRWIRDELSDKVKSRMTFTGMLTGLNKLEVFAGSDVFVLPSYSESFGMAIVEAMACGIPVVISDSAGISADIRKRRAGIVVKCDAESLYSGIDRILQDEELAMEISKNGRMMVENDYSISRVADSMLETFDSILRR